MKKLLIVLALTFASQAQAIEVTKDWTLILNTGETAMVIPESGEIKILWSIGKPVAKKYIGLVLRKKDDDFAMFTSAPSDVWARTYTTKPVTVTVNKSTDISKDD